MAMMAKMRSLAPAFIITIGGIFVLFMVLSDSRVTEILGQRSQNVGSVNGEDITYQQFSTFLEQAREYQKNQTGRDIEEENMDAFNDQVWDALVTQQLIKGEIDKYGITVSDKEINDAIFGPNPPDFLRNQFVDSTGRFNRQLYEQTLLQQKKDVLLAVEEQVRQMKLQEKLQNYLFGSITISEGELNRRFADQTVKANVEYALVDVAAMSDSGITVSEQDMQNYYNKNKDKYKVEAQRNLKYVLFSKAASREDSMAVLNNLKAIAEKARKDTSFKSYVEIYSERPFSKDTLGMAMLTPEAAAMLSNAAPGSIVGPVPSYEGAAVYRLINKVPAKDTYVRASHILIPAGADDAKALAEANDIYNKLVSGANFEQMAREKSTDFASARNGGDLGWFGKGQMVKEFEDAVFNGQVGQVQKPVKTSYGYHVIKVTGKSSSNFVVESIVNSIKASGSTIDNAFNSAKDFAYVADKNGFDSEAKLMKHRVQETPAFTEDAMGIPGIGGNKELVKFAFENDLNDVSEVYKVPAGYIVAKVSEVVNAGFRKYEDLKGQLRPAVIREKKFEKAKVIAEQISSQAKGQPLAAAAANRQYVKYDTTGFFSAAQSIPGIGRDYVFADKAMDAKVNSMTGPVKGQRGYYVLRVISRHGFDKSQYAIQRNSVRDNLLQEKKNTFYNQWITQLKNNADIEDNRRAFYR